MLFLDSTDPREIQEIFGWGVVSGLTTNPLLLARSGIRDVSAFVKNVLAVSTGPLSIEVTGETEDAMVEEAETLHLLGGASLRAPSSRASSRGSSSRGSRSAEAPSHDARSRIAVKVPFSELGLRATHRLVSKGIAVNMTCCMSFPQAYLASLAGARYVSVLVGRVRDMGYRAEPVIEDLRAQIDRERLDTQIIVGSLRQVLDVTDALSAGAHIATVPGPVLRKMLHNPKTDETIREFNDAWNALGASEGGSVKKRTRR